MNAFDKLEHELRAGVRRGAAPAPEPAPPWRHRPRGLAIALIALVVCGSAAAASSRSPASVPNRSQTPSRAGWRALPRRTAPRPERGSDRLVHDRRHPSRKGVHRRHGLRSRSRCGRRADRRRGPRRPRPGHCLRDRRPAGGDGALRSPARRAARVPDAAQRLAGSRDDRPRRSSDRRGGRRRSPAGADRPRRHTPRRHAGAAHTSRQPDQSTAPSLRAARPRSPRPTRDLRAPPSPPPVTDPGRQRQAVSELRDHGLLPRRPATPCRPPPRRARPAPSRRAAARHARTPNTARDRVHIRPDQRTTRRTRLDRRLRPARNRTRETAARATSRLARRLRRLRRFRIRLEGAVREAGAPTARSRASAWSIARDGAVCCASFTIPARRRSCGPMPADAHTRTAREP